MPSHSERKGESHVVSFRNGAAHFSTVLAWAQLGLLSFS
jgi:hypothetical protein